MQFELNREFEGLSQLFFVFLYDVSVALIFGFIEVALRLGRLTDRPKTPLSAWLEEETQLGLMSNDPKRVLATGSSI